MADGNNRKSLLHLAMGNESLETSAIDELLRLLSTLSGLPQGQVQEASNPQAACKRSVDGLKS